jgi:DNA-binding CsgD family transcriptional regulator
MHKQMSVRNLANSVEANLTSFTAREREIALLLAHGGSRRVIAQRLRVSVHTIDKHLARIRNKIGALSNAEAAAVLRAPELAPARFAAVPREPRLLRAFVPVSLPATPDVLTAPVNVTKTAAYALLAPMGFEERWRLLHALVRPFAVTHLMFALVRRGDDAKHDRAVQACWSLPEPFGQSIVGAGQPSANPVLMRVRQSPEPFATDIEADIFPHLGQLPQPAAAHARALVSAGFGRGLTVPIIGLPADIYGAVSLIFADISRPSFVQALTSHQDRLALMVHYFSVASAAEAMAEASDLSATEQALLALLAEGLSGREAGLRLGISSRSVERISGRLRQTLKARNMAHAVSLAVRGGQISL